MEEFWHESLESEDRVSWIRRKVVSLGKKVLTAGVLVSSAPLLVPPLLVASTIAFIFSVPYFLFLANYACTQKLMSSLLPATEEEIDSKLSHDEADPWMALTDTKKDEEMTKESTVLQQAPHEGELGSTTTETFTQNDLETSSYEPNDQAVYSEEQMWEKMEALRKVVGYSVARSATYAEELKALYVFTGVVEPPQSRLMKQDSREIAHGSSSLRFLLSVIGIN